MSYAIQQLKSMLEDQKMKLEQVARDEEGAIADGRGAQARVDAQQRVVNDLVTAIAELERPHGVAGVAEVMGMRGDG